MRGWRNFTIRPQTAADDGPGIDSLPALPNITQVYIPATQTKEDPRGSLKRVPFGRSETMGV